MERAGSRLRDPRGCARPSLPRPPLMATVCAHSPPGWAGFAHAPVNDVEDILDTKSQSFLGALIPHGRLHHRLLFHGLLFLHWACIAHLLDDYYDDGVSRLGVEALFGCEITATNCGQLRLQYHHHTWPQHLIWIFLSVVFADFLFHFSSYSVCCFLLKTFSSWIRMGGVSLFFFAHFNGFHYDKVPPPPFWKTPPKAKNAAWHRSPA